MNNYQPTPEGKDEATWRLAQERVAFKRHALVFVLVNAFLWIIYFANTKTYYKGSGFNLPWPFWATIGWGIGLVSHYLKAYSKEPFGEKGAEKEYEKLINKK
jgi:hypothetical protein